MKVMDVGPIVSGLGAGPGNPITTQMGENQILEVLRWLCAASDIKPTEWQAEQGGLSFEQEAGRQ